MGHTVTCSVRVGSGGNAVIVHGGVCTVKNASLDVFSDRYKKLEYQRSFQDVLLKHVYCSFEACFRCKNDG
jgi:hypothetical protein